MLDEEQTKPGEADAVPAQAPNASSPKLKRRRTIAPAPTKPKLSTKVMPTQVRKRRLVTPTRAFPFFTLEKALPVASAIKEKNAGNPWPPTEVAKAIGYSERSSSIDNVLRSSAMYGLTTGTRAASHLTLEKLGRDIVYAPTAEAETLGKQRAFLNVELFSKVLEYYKGNNLPETQFLSNTLVSEFGVPAEHHEDFRRIFDENCRFVGIGSSWEGPGSSTTSFRSSGAHPSTSEPANVRSYVSEVNADGKKCFVIMPFSERSGKRPLGFFDEVFDSLIKPAAEAAGFDVYTANKDGSDVIQSTIINELLDSDIVLADLTDHNPNVLFELGVRLTLEKPVAIIKSSDTGRVFDVDNMLRVFEYDQNLWTSSIKTDLPRLEGHLRASWDQRATNRSYMSILRTRD